MTDHEHTPPTEAELDDWDAAARIASYPGGSVHAIRLLRANAELRRLRAERSAARERWEAYAGHLEHCRTCGEDGVECCAKGTALGEAARQEPTP